MYNMQNNMQKNSALFRFCIFCILQYAKYAEYVKQYAAVHYNSAYCFAYCTYYSAYLSCNMQNNMQTPKLICRIVHCSDFAYW